MSTADHHPENAPESAIGRTERRFREVFESSPVGVARVGLDGTWLEVNDRFCDMLGYTREELVQIRPWNLIHPEDLKDQLEERSRLISGDAQYVSTETRFIRKDGKATWIARTMSLVRRPIRHAAVFRLRRSRCQRAQGRGRPDPLRHGALLSRTGCLAENGSSMELDR